MFACACVFVCLCVSLCVFVCLCLCVCVCVCFASNRSQHCKQRAGELFPAIKIAPESHGSLDTVHHVVCSGATVLKESNRQRKQVSKMGPTALRPRNLLDELMVRCKHLALGCIWQGCLQDRCEHERGIRPALRCSMGGIDSCLLHA